VGLLERAGSRAGEEEGAVFRRRRAVLGIHGGRRKARNAIYFLPGVLRWVHPPRVHCW
jgi:hypothetical protein